MEVDHFDKMRANSENLYIEYLTERKLRRQYIVCIKCQ